MLKRILIVASAIAAPALLPTAVQAQNSQQTRSANAPVGGVLTVFGNDPCPADTVCVRAPESDRYRIPGELRQQTGRPQTNESWAVRSQDALDASTNRTGTGSCTTVGPSGGTGCLGRKITTAKAEARARREEQTDLPLP
ncbi:hypothetical protein FHS95_003393 [Sphingomonas naasensis]|uniref:Secreted protein n=1 Tax=Sphingomonas naasensis TaxID=1344951 RepID=A0A4V3QW63_9SPHN|nr:hypothetical protein [Sphingomonas naasensis]NIJ21690.1 hypothetical protein [Sphingomonas naasensis]TGX41382.1 hypothetical protein E5A74_12135 [Sphingomonas naasensis]